MANFRVGQKVVCIKQGAWLTWDPGDKDNRNPQYNEICTIKGFITVKGLPCLQLKGFACNYAANQFRPVHTIESDSEMFKRISEDSFGRLEVLEEVLNELGTD